MSAWLIFLMCLVSNVMTENSIITPLDYILPKLSGIKSIYVEKPDGQYRFTFSGSIDASKFSPNMMIEGPHTITTSSTYYYPSDRSYYGMAYSIDSNNNKVIIVFGGIGTEGVYGDFWSYKIDQDTWNKLELELPEPLYDFAYTYIYDEDIEKTTIYIVGGINNINIFVKNTYKCVLEDNYCEIINKYVDCVGFPLAGADLLHFDGFLYLVSGYYQKESQGFFTFKHFSNLCLLDLNDESLWVLKSSSNNANIFEKNHGGSCLYNNMIFYFFGSFVSDSGIEHSDIIYTLDLVTYKWDEATFECPEGLDCAIDSFAIKCSGNYATITGGKNTIGSTNSYIKIDMSTIIVKDYIPGKNYPSPRGFATFTQSSAKLILFGGINKGELSTEVWEFEFISVNELGTWRLLTILGNAPEPRYGHAAAAQGIFTFYVGGKTYDDRILSDIWLLNSLSNTWTEFIPSDTKIPPVTRTCAMLDLPKLYFIGGLDYSGSNFDLWEYDISTNTLVLLRETQSNDIGTFGHACALIKKNDKVFIYTFYGMKNIQNDLYCNIRKIDITDTNRITVSEFNIRKDFSCRGNFGYSFDGETMVFVGGEVYPDFTMNDLWVIRFQDYYQEFLLADESKNVRIFNEKLSGSSVITFSDYILVFSGYYNGSFSINSDLSSSIYAIPYSGQSFCSAGFYLKDGKCQPCQEGTYSPLGTNFCLPCPLGSVNYLSAASHISQCIPCALGTFYNETSNQCEECSEDLLCPVGAYEPLDPDTVVMEDQQTQPIRFKPPTKASSLLYIVVAGLSLLFLFSITFCTSLYIKISLSIISFFKEDHQKISDENSDQSAVKCARTFGGYISGVVIIVYIFYIIMVSYDYHFDNEIEVQGLVPLLSVIQNHDFTNNHLKLEIYMYSYRGNCTESSTHSSNLFDVEYKDITEKPYGNNSTLCTHTLQVNFDELFLTEAYAELDFLSYTSDIAVTVSVDSGTPGYKSSVTQSISTNDGDVLTGNDPNVFSFSIIPAIYGNLDMLGNYFESLGFRLVSTKMPIKGSRKTVENIHLATGFKIKVKLALSEFGIETYRIEKVDVIKFILSLLSLGPAIVGIFKYVLIVNEIIYLKIKKVELVPNPALVEYKLVKNSNRNSKDNENDNE